MNIIDRIDILISEKKTYNPKLYILQNVFKKRFNTIRSSEALDNLYSDFIEQSKKWNWTNYNDEQLEWLNSQFKEVAKKLKINKIYKLGK